MFFFLIFYCTAEQGKHKHIVGSCYFQSQVMGGQSKDYNNVAHQ